MQPGPNIVLIGLRGSGKSTLGRALADRLGLPFVDLDDVTPQLLGRASVADAWRHDGELAFRRAEARALEQELTLRGRVLALGGGTPTAPRAADLLREHALAGRAVIVYLRAPAPALRRRLEATGPGAGRPSLTGAGPLDEIAAVLAARDPLYASLAGLVVEVEGKDIDSCIAQIIPAIQSP